MKHALIAAFIVVFGASAIAGSAAKMPKLSDKPAGTEIAFVRSIQSDLMKRFPKAADAEKAGYVRYTYEDNTGAISYANRVWQSVDPQHPSQLWYDVNGNLLGADYSVLLKNSPKPPRLWGVNPKRWIKFRQHVHYIAVDPVTKKQFYGGFGPKSFGAAGGDLSNPTAEAMVKASKGKIKSAADVVSVFEFPALWDLIVWVKPNPSGAFAEKNPNVTPSKDAEKAGM